MLETEIKESDIIDWDSMKCGDIIFHGTGDKPIMTINRTARTITVPDDVDVNDTARAVFAALEQLLQGRKL